LVFSTSTELWSIVLYEERKPTQDLIGYFKVPNGTLAELSGVFRSEVSRYVSGRAVSKQFCVKIENAVAEIADILSFMQEHVGLRPDLRDVESLRNLIVELRTARTQILNATEQRLAEVSAEATAAISDFARASS
jgi:hypothetical protein